MSQTVNVIGTRSVFAGQALVAQEIGHAIVSQAIAASKTAQRISRIATGLDRVLCVRPYLLQSRFPSRQSLQPPCRLEFQRLNRRPNPRPNRRQNLLLTRRQVHRRHALHKYVTLTTGATRAGQGVFATSMLLVTEDGCAAVNSTTSAHQIAMQIAVHQRLAKRKRQHQRRSRHLALLQSRRCGQPRILRVCLSRHSGPLPVLR